MSLAAAAASMSDWRRFESPPNERSTTSIFCTFCDAGPRSALQARRASALCEAPKRASAHGTAGASESAPQHARKRRDGTPSRGVTSTPSGGWGGPECSSRGPSTRGDESLTWVCGGGVAPQARASTSGPPSLPPAGAVTPAAHSSTHASSRPRARMLAGMLIVCTWSHARDVRSIFEFVRCRC